MRKVLEKCSDQLGDLVNLDFSPARAPAKGEAKPPQRPAPAAAPKAMVRKMSKPEQPVILASTTIRTSSRS